MCVYYMLQAVQSKLEVFQRTRGRVGTPLTGCSTKTRGKESGKRIRVSLKSNNSVEGGSSEGEGEGEISESR